MELAHSIPEAVERIKVEIMDGETVLYGEAAKKMIYLNESATAVFQLCDGQRSVLEIIDLLTAAYPDESAAMRQDVVRVIDYLVQEGVLRLTRSQT